MNTGIIFNFKRGVAKTTTTILTANFLDVNHGKKVALIDADDDQWSSYSVHEEEKKKLLSKYSEKQIDKLLENKKSLISMSLKCILQKCWNSNKLVQNNDHDFLFIDLGPRKIEDTLDIFKETDHIIVPYSKDSEEIKKSVVFTNVIKRNFPEKNIKSLVVKIEKNDMTTISMTALF